MPSISFNFFLDSWLLEMSKCEDVFIVLWYLFCANKKKERKKEKRKKKKERKRKRRKKKDSTFPSSLPSFSRLPFLEFLFRLSPPPSKSNSERKKNSVPFRLCQCRYLHVFSLHFFTTSTAASLEKDVLRPFLGHETVSKTWWHNTRSGLSKKFTIVGVLFLFCFLFSTPLSECTMLPHSEPLNSVTGEHVIAVLEGSWTSSVLVTTTTTRVLFRGSCSFFPYQRRTQQSKQH